MGVGSRKIEVGRGNMSGWADGIMGEEEARRWEKEIGKNFKFQFPSYLRFK